MNYTTNWKLTLTNGTILGFTSHELDQLYDNIIYHASSAIDFSAVYRQSGLSVQQMEVQGILDNVRVREEDLVAGRFDHAQVVVFVVDDEGKRHHLLSGVMGEVEVVGQRFVAEVRSLTQYLQQPLGDYYSPVCRARLGDVRCKVALEQYQVTGVIEGVEEETVLMDATLTQPQGYFRYGTISFHTGENLGLSMEVSTYAPGRMKLLFAMPYKIAVGDQYRLVAGCDKQFNTCKGRFNNAINFRGEPFIPDVTADHG